MFADKREVKGCGVDWGQCLLPITIEENEEIARGLILKLKLILL